MKKILFLSAALVWAAAGQSQIRYERETWLSGHQSLSHFFTYDLIVDNAAANAVGVQTLTNTSTNDVETSISKWDIGSGGVFSAKRYSAPAGRNLDGRRVLAIGGNYYMLAAYENNVPTLGLVKIDGTTGAVLFSKYLASSISGLSGDFQVADFAYDNSAYIYVTGNVTGSGGQSEIWVAKLDLSGTLVWIKTYNNTANNEYAHNIDIYNSDVIYIGGIISNGTTPLQMTGLVMQINSNSTLINSQEIYYFPLPAPASERIISLTVKRNANDVFVVAQSLLGADGPGNLLVLKLNTSLVPVAYSVYLYGAFVYNEEFYFTNNKLLVPGLASQLNTATPGYVNAFFDFNTNFLNANRDNLVPEMFGTILSYPDASGYIFSLAESGLTSGHFYRMKGAPNTAQTSCDNAYVRYLAEAPLTVTPYPLALTLVKAQVMNNFVCTMNNVNYTHATLCYYDPWAQRTDGSGAEAMPQTVQLFPNPAAGHLDILLPEGLVLEQAEVFDFSGRLVAKQEETVSVKTTIGLENLATGIYMLRLHTSDGRIITEKFMKE